MRQHTNTAEMPTRRLLKQYDNTATKTQGSGQGAGTNALGNTAPNTLNSNLPRISDATGVTGRNGVMSFLHNGASQVFTLYFWYGRLNKVTGAQGWVKGAETSAGSTKTVDQYALCTITCPEGVPFFLQATGTDVTECFVSGDSDSTNMNTDFTKP